MAYVFGTTFVCDNMDNAKKVGIKSVFNILPLYNVGQKSRVAQLPRPEQCCFSCTLYTSSSSSVDHWKGRGIHRDLLPNTTIRHRTLNPVLKSFHNHGEENENVKKAIGWLGKNNNSARASRLFCRFLYRHCTTATGKWLISRFMKDITKRRLNNLSLSEVEYVSLQFSSKRVRLHLTKLESWSNRDRD